MQKVKIELQLNHKEGKLEDGTPYEKVECTIDYNGIQVELKPVDKTGKAVLKKLYEEAQ